MSTTYVKRGDVGSKIVASLLDGDNQPVNLNGATVRFLMRPLGGALKVNGLATIEDAAAGLVSYTWTAANLDTLGTYQAEWEVTYASGVVQTFPSDRYLYVIVLSDLG